MRFMRFERYEKLSMSDRKAAAFARKQAKERARYPLFADHVAGEQHSLEVEQERRHKRVESFEESMRAFHARVWRQTRARYFQLDDITRAEIRQKWKVWTGPITSTYFASMVDTISGDQAKRVEAARQDYLARRASLPIDSKACTARLF